MRCTYIQSFGFNESIFRQKMVAVGKIFTLSIWLSSLYNEYVSV